MNAARLFQTRQTKQVNDNYRVCLLTFVNTAGKISDISSAHIVLKCNVEFIADMTTIRLDA